MIVVVASRLLPLLLLMMPSAMMLFPRLLIVPLVLPFIHVSVLSLAAVATEVTNSMVGHDSLRQCFLLLLLLDNVVTGDARPCTVFHIIFSVHRVDGMCLLCHSCMCVCMCVCVCACASVSLANCALVQAFNLTAANMCFGDAVDPTAVQVPKTRNTLKHFAFASVFS